MGDSPSFISEAKLNEARLDALFQLSRMMNASLREISTFALEQAVILTGSQIGYLAFMNADETVMTMHAWSTEAMARCEMLDRTWAFAIDQLALLGEPIRRRRAVITNDYAEPDSPKHGLPDGHVPIRRHLSLPVFDGSKIVAVAAVGNKQTPYGESDVHHLTLLMESMWALIHRNQVLAELKLHQDELEHRVAERSAELLSAHRRLAAEHETVLAEQDRLRRLLALLEQERRLIAFEIHDGLAQQLTAATMQLQSLQPCSERKAEECQQTFRIVQDLLAEGLREARALISGLRPPSLDEYGVEAAIQELILRAASPKFDIQFSCQLHDNRFTTVLENAIFRIVQEGITNFQRHAKADRLQIALTQHERSIEIEIRDWGHGFDPSGVSSSSFGLEGIRERVRLLGGHVEIASAPGQGTRISAAIPV